MKLFTRILMITILSSNFLFSSHITPEETIIDGKEVVISLDEDDKGFFQTVDYNEQNESLEFETSENIEVIQIFNLVNEMVYQIPVYSKDVEISKSLLETGSYYFVFLSDNSITKSTTVFIK